MPRLWDFSSIVSPHECPVAPLDQVCRAGPNHPTGSTPDQSHHATYALSAYMYNIIYSHYSIKLRYGPTVAPVGSTKSLGVHCTVGVGHFFVPHEGLKNSMYNVFLKKLGLVQLCHGHTSYFFYTGRIFQSQYFTPKNYEKHPKITTNCPKKCKKCIFYVQSGKFHTGHWQDWEGTGSWGSERSQCEGVGRKVPEKIGGR